VAALGGKHFEVAELLHRNGADVDVRDRWEDTPLSEGCKAGVLDVVQWLLNHGADVNSQDFGLQTSLHRMAGLGHSSHAQVSRMLIEHNADIHIRNHCGDTPLHFAASPYYGVRVNVDIMQVLLDHGANPNARDNSNSTPLHHSSGSPSGRCGTAEGTRLLLKHGAIIDAEDNFGRTPLQLALEYRRDDIARCLKEHGATR
jgi:ankyrin repeat protein